MEIIKTQLARPRADYWKQRFDSENASNVFRPHYAGEIWKRNNHRSFWIYDWGNLGQGNGMVIAEVIVFEKLCFENMFSVHA